MKIKIRISINGILFTNNTFYLFYGFYDFKIHKPAYKKLDYYSAPEAEDNSLYIVQRLDRRFGKEI